MAKHRSKNPIKKNIFVTESIETLAEIGKILENKGYHFLYSSLPETVLNDNLKIDLAIFDSTPEGLIPQLRNKYSKLPIILIDDNYKPSIKEKYNSLGVCFLERKSDKSFDSLKVIKTIEKYLLK